MTTETAKAWAILIAAIGTVLVQIAGVITGMYRGAEQAQRDQQTQQNVQKVVDGQVITHAALATAVVTAERTAEKVDATAAKVDEVHGVANVVAEKVGAAAPKE